MTRTSRALATIENVLNREIDLVANQLSGGGGGNLKAVAQRRECTMGPARATVDRNVLQRRKNVAQIEY